MTDFRMPSLGADMDAGTLVQWMKKPGDVLERGDIIAIVETQKGAIEIEVFESGVLEATLVQPGEEVPVGHVLATISASGEAIASKQIEVSAEAQVELNPVPVPAPPAERTSPRARLTPLARRLVRERNLDLARLVAAADGIIGLREIEQAHQNTPPRRVGRIDAGEMRKAIAAAMTRSNRDIPHYYVSTAIDVSSLMTWLTDRNAARPVGKRLLYAAPLLKAVARALGKFEQLNGIHENGVFAPAREINVGVAIAMRRGGLMTPAILGVDEIDVDTLMIKLNDLVGRVRGGGLRSSELSMGTVTLTNLGERTADAILPMIYPPQVAIVGCGQIRDRPWVVDKQIVPRPILEITVGGDHRVSDGRVGAQFLRNVEELLSKPEDL